jgi:hypothetical protein
MPGVSASLKNYECCFNFGDYGTLTMAITYRGAGTVVNVISGTSLALVKPASTAATDILIAQITINGSGFSITPPAGWELMLRTNSSTTISGAMYWALGNVASTTFTVTNNPKASGCIIGFIGVDNTTPLDAVTVGQGNTSSTNVTSPSITTVSNSAMLVYLGAVTNNNTTNTLFNGPWATEAWEGVAGGANPRTHGEGVYQRQATAGVSGAKTSTVSTAGVNVGMLAALRPAATPLFDITHETADLSQYDASVTDGGDLAVTTGAALVGSYGLRCLVNDGTAIYGDKAFTATPVFRGRFYIDPNSFSYGAGDTEVMYLSNSSLADVAAINFLGGSPYGFELYAVNDADSWSLAASTTTMSDAPHYVEIYVVAATQAGKNDGVMQVWLDGAYIGGLTNIDSDVRALTIANVRFGAKPWNNPSGTLFLDDFKANGDGSVIGPADTTILKTVTDAGAGLDASPTLAAAFGLTDSGAGNDVPGNLAAVVPLSDTGAGTDVLPTLAAALNMTDGGVGSDDLPTLSAALSLADSGAGSDTPDQITARIPITDAGSGADGFTLAIQFALADTGTGLDSATLQQVLAIILDTGVGLDDLGAVSVSLQQADTGTGLDDLQATISLAVADTGGGIEEPLNVFKEILIQLADAGAGLDSLGALTVSLAVAEAGSGDDTPAVSVSLQITDAAAALDAVNVITELLIQISDIGAAIDGISLGPVQVNVTDASTGTDQTAITVNVALTDTGGGDDIVNLVMAGLLVTVADVAAGADTVGYVTVNLGVADSGLGTEQLAALLVKLAVADYGAGLDKTVSFDASVQIISISFTFLRRAMTFLLSARSIEFQLTQRSIEFSLN